MGYYFYFKWLQTLYDLFPNITAPVQANDLSLKKWPSTSPLWPLSFMESLAQIMKISVYTEDI